MGYEVSELPTKAARGLDALDAERRVVAIRDHLVRLVQSRGNGHQYGLGGMFGPLHLTTWETGPFRFVLRTPYRPSGMPIEADARRLGPVPQRASNPALLPYGLDVWRRHRVLSVAWDPNGPVEVVSFRRGAWEAETLAL